jgi:DNA-directed RNA polymerase subunit RPC12/RpoP
MNRHVTTLPLRALLIVVFAIALVWPGIAGTGFEVKCAKCGFKANFDFGGEIPGRTGPLGRIVIGTGYCCSCEKIVRVFSNPNAPEEERAKSPDLIGEVFCFDTGRKYMLYPCPDCGKPFIAIRENEFEKDDKPVTLYCPKCGEKSLDVTGEYLWD